MLILNNLKSAAVNITIILSVTLTIFLALREEITFAGSWLVTISLKKFIIAIILYCCAFTTVLLAETKYFKAKIFSITFLALVGLFSSHSDFFSLKGGESFYGNTNNYHYKNNNYLEDNLKIREIKYSSSNIQNLWRSICDEYDNFCYDAKLNEFEKAENAMLIVSAFFDYGNESEKNHFKSGCVGNSEETNFQILTKNFSLYRSSDIGCCNDFAYLLASFLNHLSITNHLITFPGHVANIINIDKKSFYIDANTNLIVGNFLNRGDKHFFIYPHSNVSKYSRRFTILNFQNNLIENISSHKHFIYNFLSILPSDRVNKDYFH